MSAVLTKKELLQWASHVSGGVSCAIYNDLRDGLVLLGVVTHLFRPVLQFYEEQQPLQTEEEEEEEEGVSQPGDHASGVYYDINGRRSTGKRTGRGQQHGSYVLHSNPHPANNSSTVSSGFLRQKKLSYLRLEQNTKLIRYSSLRDFLTRQRRGPREEGRCWLLFEELLHFFQFPVSLLNVASIRRGGTARHCYQALTCFYFMDRMINDNNNTNNKPFSIGLSSPIDPSLAEFLQSPACLKVTEEIKSKISRDRQKSSTNGAAGRKSVTSLTAAVATDHPNPRRRQTPSPPSTASTHSPPPPSDQFQEPLEYSDTDDDDNTGRKDTLSLPPRLNYYVSSYNNINSEKKHNNTSPPKPTHYGGARQKMDDPSFSSFVPSHTEESKIGHETQPARRPSPPLDTSSSLEQLRALHELSLMECTTKSATDLFQLKTAYEERLRQTEEHCRGQLQEQLAALLETLNEAHFDHHEGDYYQDTKSGIMEETIQILKHENAVLRDQLRRVQSDRQRELQRLGDALEDMKAVALTPFQHPSPDAVEQLVQHILTSLEEVLQYPAENSNDSYYWNSIRKSIEVSVAELGHVAMTPSNSRPHPSRSEPDVSVRYRASTREPSHAIHHQSSRLWAEERPSPPTSHRAARTAPVEYSVHTNSESNSFHNRSRSGLLSLSPDVLEERKRAILQKYGISN